MQILWFIPTHGDGHYLGTAIGGRAITPDYLGQIAQAVDHLGYTGALLPTRRSCALKSGCMKQQGGTI